MSLSNPYLDLFEQLPACFKRGAQTPVLGLDSIWPDWLKLKHSLARHFAWAVPTSAAVACIGRHTGHVVEPGAGSGYWCWLLNQAGVRTQAFDLDPPGFTWTDVSRSDGLAALASTPRGAALLLCWPPWGSRMALEALDAYRGDCVVYVGEWLLGCAEPGFFAALSARFNAVDHSPIPQWFDRDDHLSVWHRRSSGGG